jgi:predicted HTH transcriptional regulator
MRINFGDKTTQEAMRNNPLLRGKWEEAPKVHALNRVDHLIEKIGVGIVQTVETYYKRYLETPNEKNAKAYVVWRLRLHRRLKNDRPTLEAINEARNLGLFDEAPGKTFWDCEF